MDVATFTISTTAVLVSLAALIYSRRQAVSARQLAQIENARRVAECRPELTARAQHALGCRWIWIGNEGPGDVDALTVSAIYRNDGREGRLRGFYDSETYQYRPELELGPVRLGTGLCVMVQDDLDSRQRTQLAQLRCDYSNAAGHWTCLLTVDFAAMEYL